MKVSIAVPVFEYYGFGVEMLDDMFRTISQQTLKDVEVVISDHSVDTEIEEYCDENEYDLNIKYIRNVEARGNPAVNTNNAIDHSTGEIIKIFQQDDFLYDTEALQKMYDVMNDSPAQWYACGAIHTRDDGHSFFNPMLPLLHEKMITDPGFNYIGGLSVLTIKNGVDVRFDPNVRMCLDVDFYYSMLLKYGEPILHHDVLIANRVRDENTLMADVSEEETLQEFDYVHKKFGIKK
jgi:glycosyltransferase involved in cell wall biosynthesis|tara:strand:- start:140 stop:847 length:708 start_codon:yes stop_codon:yes gene_type:complete